MVHPVVVGTGKRLFGQDAAATTLELLDSRKVGPDVLLLIYRPATAGKAEQPAAISRLLRRRTWRDGRMLPIRPA